ISLDLSRLNAQDEIEEINNTAKMMNISQLKYTIDSLEVAKNREFESFLENNNIQTQNTFTSKPKTVYIYQKAQTDDLLENLSKSKKLNILRNAASMAETTAYAAKNNMYMMDEYQKNINRHWLSFYDKFVIAFSCILMFFIGAPLGAIIRKGGMGLPMVLAVLIFIIYHFINTFGKKVAQENGMPAVLGAWLST